MAYHHKSYFVVTSVIVIILLSLLGYLYYTKIYTTHGNPDLFWESASIKISTNLGGCPAAFPCYEVYELDSDLGSAGNVLHNGAPQGQISEVDTTRLIKTVFDLYKNNVCTPFYTAPMAEKYNLIIDNKILWKDFGSDQGCKEMQDIINTIKGAGSV